jgi:acetoin:2,6-dichlorophenolindophenol oxidoreductase subunit alpha
MTGTNVDTKTLLAQIHLMRRIRAFELAAIQALEEGLVPGPIHPSIGQEACAVGIVGDLRRDDILLSTHRGHGHTLVKGASPTAMMCELLGRADGCCGGKGGSMHIADFGVGMLGANGVVGANIIIAAGAAHGISLHGDDRVVVNIFGDGAINRGPFLEGLNWARIYNLPVLFVCEDNTFAATTRSADLTAGAGPVVRAEALGIPAVSVDGNDLQATEEAAESLIAAVRSGDGPRFLHARTYRLTGHTATDGAPYRDSDEVNIAWTNDPIGRCEALVLGAGIAQAELDAVKTKADDEMAAVLEFARAAPFPEPAMAFADVQDIGADSRATEVQL